MHSCLMSLRKNILLINLKIHSAYNKFFSEKIYTFDAYSALDIIGYLRGVHHKFSKHMVDIASGKSEDCFNLLDGNLQEITDEMLYIKKFKEGETVHLVPTICGGGGKSGRKMFMIFAIAVVVMNPALLGSVGSSLGSMFGAGAGAPLNAIPQLGAVTTGAGTGLSFMQTMGLNLAHYILGHPSKSTVSTFAQVKLRIKPGFIVPMPIHLKTCRKTQLTPHLPTATIIKANKS